MSNIILVINTGSTSTKIGLFKNSELLFEKTIRYSSNELNNFNTILEQYSLRKKSIINALLEKKFTLDRINVIVSRGGVIKPIEGGTYIINDLLVKALKQGALESNHACNLAGLIAFELGKDNNIKSYMVDPPCVDEMTDIAKVTGLQGIDRSSVFHALNQKAVARRAAKQLGKRYEDCNFVVAHIGGGVSVGAHKKGKVVDVNNALDGDGPFSPERAGGMPVKEIIDMCYSGKFTKQQIKKMLVGNGGIVSYLETNDFKQVMNLVSENDDKAVLIVDAMIYQIAKEIGSMVTVLKGDVNSIIITGGIAYSKVFCDKLLGYIDFLGNCSIYPGEDELIALVEGGIRVINGEETAKLFN